MSEFDVKAFWAVNDTCFTPFSTKKKRIPLAWGLDDHFLMEALQLPSTLRYYKDFEYRLSVHRQFNDMLERELGRRFYEEHPVETPTPNRFEVLMGSRWELREGGTPWLESHVREIEDVVRIIEAAEKLDMKVAAFPDDWKEKKTTWESTMGTPFRTGGSFARGPATMATSILGTENTCYFMMDEPEVMDAFFDVLARKLVEYHEALMADTGRTEVDGYALTDDNCCLFPPAQYERFCAPVLARLFARFAPLPGQKRYQHSDSEMGHLMGILADLGVNEANLGPTLKAQDIRKAMPKTVIHGQIAPFLLRNGTKEDIIAAVRRDIDAVGGDGGLVQCPAGSVAGGTSMKNLRTYMWALEEYGRY